MLSLIQAACKTAHISAWGVAPATTDILLQEQLEERHKAGLQTCFETHSPPVRSNPSLLLPDARSVLVCLFPYLATTNLPVNIARYAWGQDYHLVIRHHLEHLAILLAQDFPSLRWQIQVDNGPLCDRRLAFQAGLGFYGHNGCLIHPRLGSWFFIGSLVTNLTLPFSTSLAMSCKNCGLCQQHCPGQCLSRTGLSTPTHCKSYLTQLKGELALWQIEILRSTPLIFGCDRCQEVCPHNQIAHVDILPEFSQDLLTFLTPEQLLSLSNKEFKRQFGRRAFSWRGKQILLRNLAYLNY